MNRIRRIGRRTALGVTALTAAAIGLTSAAGSAGAAPSSATPPTADTALLGTWVNTDANTRSLTQVVVGRDGTGGITVDAFGACTPSPCEFGAVPATVYGTSVSSSTGRTFQAHQSTSGFAERTLTGALSSSTSAPRLTVTMLSTFVDGSGRHDYVVTDTFAPGSGAAASVAGTPVTAYSTGNPAKLAPGAIGNWTNTNTATDSLARIVVGGTAAHPTVHAYGRCGAGECDLGSVAAIAFGKSVSAGKGTTALAPYELGFKRTQLVVSYRHTHRGDLLSVGEYNEFTDGSGRANYALTETFAKS